MRSISSCLQNSRIIKNKQRAELMQNSVELINYMVKMVLLMKFWRPAETTISILTNAKDHVYHFDMGMYAISYPHISVVSSMNFSLFVIWIVRAVKYTWLDITTVWNALHYTSGYYQHIIRSSMTCTNQISSYPSVKRFHNIFAREYTAYDTIA